jgi:hypothetical protein
MRRSWLPLVAVLSFACGTPKAATEEDPLLDAEKDDSFRKPTDHGALLFGQSVTESLDRGARYHAWSFTLPGSASVQIKTSYGGRGTPDTVVYLYRRGETGWGSAIAKNDDAHDDTRWSSLSRALDAGVYRVIVKGYTANEVGRFKLTVDCAGDGCTAAPAPSCLFGETFRDLTDEGLVRVVGRTRFTSPTAPTTLTTLQEAQIIRALHASSHTDVMTIAQAFAAADQNEINLVWIWDGPGDRRFVAVEYGAGDNSYGAYFPVESAEPVAEIHDGDLLECTVKAETCLFADTFPDVRRDGTFVVESTTVLTVASALTAMEEAQLLAAVRESYEDVATVADAFASVDGAQINRIALRHRATGRRFTAFEYGAGDSSCGAIFTAATISRAAEISDGDITNCAAFR